MRELAVLSLPLWAKGNSLFLTIETKLNRQYTYE